MLKRMNFVIFNYFPHQYLHYDVMIQVDEVAQLLMLLLFLPSIFDGPTYAFSDILLVYSTICILWSLLAPERPKWCHMGSDDTRHIHKLN